MATDTVTIDQFVTDNGITIKCAPYPANRACWSYDPCADHWKVRLQRDTDTAVIVNGAVDMSRSDRVRVMTLTFSKGSGHNGAEPTADEVLDCLASDAAGVENTSDFEDWCSYYGYDADSRKAEKIYKACVHQSERLKTFLGDDLYEQLLWNTERM
jgi:hypothetical protein